MLLYFVRHGETNYNVQGLYNDVPNDDVYLTKKGKQQAEELASKLRGIKPDVISISEFPRTYQTAKIIDRSFKVPIIVDKLLNDRRIGFNNSPIDAIRRELRYIYKKFKNGESWIEFERRIKQFLKELKNKEHSCVIIVAHESVLRTIKGFRDKWSHKGMHYFPLEKLEIVKYII